MNILRAEQYLQTRVPFHSKVSELYDDDDMLRDALSVLFPGFEYPDISHLTFRELWARYQKNPKPLHGTPAAGN
jgi:hypothetical protein